MLFDVKQEKSNPLLKRKELIVQINYEGRSTSSRAEMELALSKNKNIDVDKIEIRKIISDHGKSTGKAWVWLHEEAVKKKRVGIVKKEEPKTEEKPAEAKPTEKPTEEKKAEPAKEEPKTEEKPAEAKE